MSAAQLVLYFATMCPSELVLSAASRYNIWQRSIQPNPLKFSTRRRKNILDPTLFKTNRSTDTPLDAGTVALAFNFGFSAVWADSPHQSR
ncbi:hypothetical protein J6590_099641 [Homalodisca vitripennis]|nr:hypothetical protein J6590_099641 [Homalodisca vitripennis]